MFTLFKPLKPPKKAPVQDSGYDGLPVDYEKLARDAGFSGFYKVQHDVEQQARLSKFRKFLSENGICIYDTEKVQKYLDRLRPSGTDVVWCGLDGRIAAANFKDMNYNGSTQMYYNRIGGYTKPIPEVPLMTLAKIRTEFPQAVGYVSDFMYMQQGDPFLAVRYEDEFFIIERWDEPGFRM